MMLNAQHLILTASCSGKMELFQHAREILSIKCVKLGKTPRGEMRVGYVEAGGM